MYEVKCNFLRRYRQHHPPPKKEPRHQSSAYPLSCRRSRNHRSRQGCRLPFPGNQECKRFPFHLFAHEHVVQVAFWSLPSCFVRLAAILLSFPSLDAIPATTAEWDVRHMVLRCLLLDWLMRIVLTRRPFLSKFLSLLGVFVPSTPSILITHVSFLISFSVLVLQGSRTPSASLFSPAA